jgi:Predicted transcriptional regulators
MNEMNELLSMIENPTRRRILEVLAIEPHYPLQLSKELGVSQPAIVKHLDQMERIGMIRGYQEESRMGPKKTLYVPNSEFTLLVDMRNGMFTVRLAQPSDSASDGLHNGVPSDALDELEKNREEKRENRERERIEGIQEIRNNISEIDQQLREVEELRSKMIRRRESLISMMLNAVSESSTYRHRSLLYELLNEPEKDLNELSMDLSMNLERAREMIQDIERIFKNERR